jgi:hypothetical protein
LVGVSEATVSSPRERRLSFNSRGPSSFVSCTFVTRLEKSSGQEPGTWNVIEGLDITTCGTLACARERSLG